MARESTNYLLFRPLLDIEGRQVNRCPKRDEYFACGNGDILKAFMNLNNSYPIYERVTEGAVVESIKDDTDPSYTHLERLSDGAVFPKSEYHRLVCREKAACGRLRITRLTPPPELTETDEIIAILTETHRRVAEAAKQECASHASLVIARDNLQKLIDDETCTHTPSPDSSRRERAIEAAVRGALKDCEKCADKLSPESWIRVGIDYYEAALSKEER